MTGAIFDRMIRPRTILLCHHDAPIHWDGLARWLASWSELRGVVIVEEPRSLTWKRLRREAGRIGWLRLLDVAAFRCWYRLTQTAGDTAWLNNRLGELRSQYLPLPSGVLTLRVASPNSSECQAFLTEGRPDLVLALVKNILAERIFAIASAGTIVLHPGICPEYRNSHGCFWAMANDDTERVGMTLLQIDRGVDTGPVYGYFTTDFDEMKSTHIQIQHAMVFDNLPDIARRMMEIAEGSAVAIPTTGRPSQVWGQPWLTAYLRWKRNARRRRDARRRS